MKKTKAAICLLVILALTLIFSPSVNPAKAQTQPTISIIPSNTQVTQNNQIITFNVTISNVQNLWSWTFDIVWDPTIFTYVGTTDGTFLTQIGTTMFMITEPPINGTLDGCSDTLETQAGASGNGPILQLQLKVTNTSFTTTTLYLNNIALASPPTNLAGTGIPITPSSTTESAILTYSSGGAPSANAGQNQVVTAGTQITLDGSQSLSSGTNPTYTWTFIDGTPKSLSGKTETYTFSTPGIYTVTLNVTDSNGSSNSTVTITAQSSTPPVAKIVLQGATDGQTISTSQTITFDGTTSSEANNGTIAKYVWRSSKGDVAYMNVGLDDMGIIGTNATINYAFTSGGTTKNPLPYNVTLTVYDATGLNDTAFVTFNVVKGAAPASTPTPLGSTPTPSSDTPTPTDTTSGGDGSSPTPDIIQTSTSLPAGDLAIIILVTIAVLGGSTFWLRKKT